SPSGTGLRRRFEKGRLTARAAKKHNAAGPGGWPCIPFAFGYAPRPWFRWSASMTGVAFVVAVVSLILAVVFWLQGRSAAEAVAGLKAEADAARKDADA